jgi:hypothetical protein
MSLRSLFLIKSIRVKAAAIFRFVFPPHVPFKDLKLKIAATDFLFLSINGIGFAMTLLFYWPYAYDKSAVLLTLNLANI